MNEKKALKELIPIILVFVIGVMIIHNGSQFATIGGSARIKNRPPDVRDILLYSDIGNEVSSIDPYSLYTVVIVVKDANSWRDINKVKIDMYKRGYSGDPSEADRYIFVYENGEMYEEGQEGHIVSWAVRSPRVDIFELHVNITLGLARMGKWIIKAKAWDRAGKSDTKRKRININFFGEVSIQIAQLVFEGYPDELTEADRVVTGTIIANGDYSLAIKATDFINQDNESIIIPVENLKFNTIEDANTAVNASYDYQEIQEYSGSYTNGDEFTLYFWLYIPAGTLTGVYQATIYLTLINK